MFIAYSSAHSRIRNDELARWDCRTEKASVALVSELFRFSTRISLSEPTRRNSNVLDSALEGYLRSDLAVGRDREI